MNRSASGSTFDREMAFNKPYQRFLEISLSTSPFIKAVVFCVVIALLVAAFSLVLRRMQHSSSHKSKGERAKEMQQAFRSIEKSSAFSNSTASMKLIQDQGEPTMEITQLWIFPIKSIRGCRVSNATMTRQGFALDRKFMLLHVQEENPRKLKNMHVSHYPSMSLFHPYIEEEKILVAYRASGLPETAITTPELEIPLVPSTFANLKTIDVDMHGSCSVAYEMGDKYKDWFSKYFGFKVILAYYGGNTRQVLGNLPGQRVPKPRTLFSNIISRVPALGPIFKPEEEVIAFNDCAPYLVITEKSNEDVTMRLPDDVEMDITKFRANIVLKGSKMAFEEDFWGELLLSDGARIILTANCGRCVSLNVDYETGKSGTGQAGKVLKLLGNDRRVDPGMKYSPIFGRYGFISKPSEGKILTVGDNVVVSRRIEERTRFYWPGIST